MKILFNLIRIIIAITLSGVSMAEAGIISVELKAEQWDTPRHGETLIKQPELGRIVRHWLDHPDSLIEIRYPGGEEGELWVGELMDWLVSLGIPSSAMHRIPGSDAEDVINMVLVARPGQKS
jgi:hypothetical protein